MKNAKGKMKKGSVLAYVLVIMTVVSIILLSLIQFVVSQLKFSYYKVEREKAFQMAEAGIYYYRWYLAHETAGKTAQQIRDFWEGGTAYGVSTPYEADFSDPESGAVGRYKIEVTPPDPYSTIVEVQSTGWTLKQPGTTREIKVRFRRPSWSEYMALADDYMRFGEGTDIYGKVHSNKGIRFDGTAHNMVTSLVPSYDDPDHDESPTQKVEFGVHTHVKPPPLTGTYSAWVLAEAPPHAVSTRSDVFEGGRQFPAPEVSFTGLVSDIGYLHDEAGVIYDDSGEGRHITLRADDKMEVRLVTSYSKDTNYTSGGCSGQVHENGDNSIISEDAPQIVDIPENGIVFVENNAWVDGVVNGRRVTIVAADPDGSGKNIFLGINNLTYTNFDGNDVIGLIAQNDVDVIRNSLDNLTIDAAMIAKDGRVGRKYYSSLCSHYDCNYTCSHGHCSYHHDCSSSYPTDHKNSITVNGAMATKQRYGFTYTGSAYNCGGGNTIGGGYCNRDLNFDNYLLYYPPPYFPTGTEYAIDLWEEQ